MGFAWDHHARLASPRARPEITRAHGCLETRWPAMVDRAPGWRRMKKAETRYGSRLKWNHHRRPLVGFAVFVRSPHGIEVAVPAGLP